MTFVATLLLIASFALLAAAAAAGLATVLLGTGSRDVAPDGTASLTGPGQEPRLLASSSLRLTLRRLSRD